MFPSIRTSLVLAASAASAAAVGLVGCTVGPDYKAPTTQVAAHWSEPVGRGPTTAPVTLTHWWTTFGDPELDSLVARAAQNNLDLRIASSRVREARANRIIARSYYYPDVNAGGGYSHTRTSQSTATHLHGIPSESDLFQGGLDAAWELDVFGGLRRSVEASEYSFQAAQEARNSTLVSLLAETALDYVDLRGLQERLRIANDNIRVQRQSLELTRSRFQAGLTSDLDVARAQAQVAATESELPGLNTAIRQTIHAIEILLGQEPGALDAELSPARPIPGTPPVIPVGLPSDLLRRRPDVRQAERNLAAATANIGVATADLFPKFNLTGNVGLSAAQFGNMGNAASAFYSIGPSITWPVFNAGRIRAQIEIANARQEQAFIQWQGAVLSALGDTENALVAYTQEQTRFQRLNEAVSANERAVDLATQLYNRGLGDFLSVLDAQRALYASQDSMVQSRATVSTDLVQLYKALGGGWEQPMPATQPIAAVP